MNRREFLALVAAASQAKGQMPGERYDGFTGPAYQTLSPAESCDRTENFYFESVEVPHQTKTDAALYQRGGSMPYGLQAGYWAANPALQQPGRALLEFDGNGILGGAIFGVSGNQFWEMVPSGAVTLWGTVVNDGKPAQIVANAAVVGQVAVISGGELYVLHSGVFTHVLNDGINFFGARAGAFIDGYLVVLSNTPNNQQFQISAINDMTTWSGADVALLEGQTDPILSLEVNVEYIYFLGSRRGEIWYNSGNALFPFVIETGAFLEYGTNAPASQVQSNALVYWMGQDARGANLALRARGLTTERISNHAVEAAWSGYSTTADCICYALTWNGHSLIRYIFPTADKGWEYDVTESAKLGYPVWNEISWVDQNGIGHAPVERAYCYGFGGVSANAVPLIISGGADGFPGLVYQLSGSVYQDCLGMNPYGAPTDLAGSGFIVGDRTIADTVWPMFGVTWTVQPPFFVTLGGGAPTGEICLVLKAGPFTSGGGPITVVRGVAGTTPQAWANNTQVQPVSFPGFPLRRVRVVRLPFNGGLRAILDRLEIFMKTGVGNPQLGQILGAQVGPVAGTGYAVGDVGTIDVLGATYTILAVANGVPTLISATATGAGYQSGTVYSTAATSGSGSGLTILVTGTTPSIQLEIANSFGSNGPIYGPAQLIPIGQQGQNLLRIVANRLGYYRDGAVRITITDPVFAAIVGAQHYTRRLTS